MKRTTSILLAGMLIAAIAGIGIVSANGADENTFFGQMHRWAADRMGYGNGYGYYGCPVYDSYASDSTTVELEVATMDEAIELAEDTTGEEIIESNIYLMGRWWVFSYTDDTDTIRQGRIDAYTGEVIEDFYTGSAYRGQYYQGRRGMSGAGYRGSGCYGY